jgi:hypothetical protein
MMCTAASLNADEAGWEISEERRELLPAQLLAQYRFAMLVDTVDLEDVLGQIHTYCRNLHSGRPFLFEWSMTLPLWHIDAVIGWGRPSHCLRSIASKTCFPGTSPRGSPRLRKLPETNPDLASGQDGLDWMLTKWGKRRYLVMDPLLNPVKQEVAA